MLLARSEAAYLLFHRGLTHSLLGILVLPPILAAGLWWGLRRRTRLGWLLLICWAGVALHVAYDVVTPWGTILLYPFALDRYAFEWLFIVDFVTWALPAAALLVGWRRPARARAATGAYLVVLATYVLLVGAAHAAVRDSVRAAERQAARPVAETFAFPRPLAPLRWQAVALAPPSTPEPRIARYAVSGVPPAPRLVDRVPRGFDDPWARRALATATGQAYLWWARVPVARVERGPGEVVVTLSDLRYRRTVAPAAEAWAPFSLRFVYDAASGALRDVEW